MLLGYREQPQNVSKRLIWKTSPQVPVLSTDAALCKVIADRECSGS